MRYLIIIFVIILSCNNSKTTSDNSLKRLDVEHNDSTKIRSVGESIHVDSVSVHMVKVNQQKDLILSYQKNYKLITRHQLDGDCYGLDSLYYDSNNRLILFIGSSGCSADESSFTSIYNSTGLIYYQLIEGGDGLVHIKSEIYYKNNNPIFGFQQNYDWDLETRTLRDSSSAVLSKEELLDITKLKRSIDDNLGNVIDRVKELNPILNYDKQYKFVDSIQQVMEKRHFLIDSGVYVDRIK